MRVIAGKFRSRLLRAPHGMDVRPTSDRLRETLFNVLTPGNPEALAGSVWLDVCAGTGAVGIEAISRGASSVYFIEAARDAARILRENLRALGITEGYEVSEREAAAALRLLDTNAVVCDYCFFDPPYAADELYPAVLGFLSQSRLLKPASIVIHVRGSGTSVTAAKNRNVS